MLVRLRNTLNEKLKKMECLRNVIVTSSSETKKEDERKKSKDCDLNDAMNNAIKMVVCNSAFNILFKLPLLFTPILNTIASIYFRSNGYKTGRSVSMDTFLNILSRSGTLELLPYVADWLYTILISTQLFVYVRFDRKIKKGLDRILKREEIIKNDSKPN